MKTILTILFYALILPLAAQQVIRTKVHSDKMNKNIETIIITPDMQKGINYKTVYILHGYSGTPNRTVQNDIPDLVQKAETCQTIYIPPMEISILGM